MKKSVKKSGNYGIDAPPIVTLSTAAGIILILAGILILVTITPTVSSIKIIAMTLMLFILGILFLMNAGLMMWGSKVGKLILRDILIESLQLAGTEKVLDVGCGRGLLLNAAAKRITSGKVIGIDLWRSIDLSGNDSAMTLMNARIEGVADKIEVKTGDMRKLPFADNSIDVVISSLAIHNVRDKKGRVQTLKEIARVLKPEGKIALLDVHCTAEYLQIFCGLGWKNVRRSELLFKTFPPMRIVTGKKPL
jgi:SAM-dependent methyltransferase